jgi:uncharacterized membrane protein
MTWKFCTVHLLLKYKDSTTITTTTKLPHAHSRYYFEGYQSKIISVFPKVYILWVIILYHWDAKLQLVIMRFNPPKKSSANCSSIHRIRSVFLKCYVLAIIIYTSKSKKSNDNLQFKLVNFHMCTSAAIKRYSFSVHTRSGISGVTVSIAVVILCLNVLTLSTY